MFSCHEKNVFFSVPREPESGDLTVAGRSGSAVGFGAVPYGVDDEGVLRLFGEADAVVADAEPEFFGVALELLDIAFAGLGEAVEGGENPHGRLAVDAAHVGAYRGCEDDLFHAGSS